MPSDSGAAWTPPASNGERRLSNSSDGSAGSGYSKALSSDGTDFLATRPHTASVIPGKPATNPLQFIRVGPADLGRNAREQLRKAELAQKTERVKTDHQEDWQSNLDNWKSSRRKRVEHIIERCVEVKRMENEPSQPRAKSKTFNEMLEERAGRRRRGPGPPPLYTDDEGHDLSDLGIGTSSTKSSVSEDCDAHSLASDGMDLDKNNSDVDNINYEISNRKLGSSANEYDTCTTNTISSPEPEEYTYEGAIEGYKSRINSNITKNSLNNNLAKEKSPENFTNGDLNRIRTSVSYKIEEKLSSFQNDRLSDIKNNQKRDLPKVDILKRREQFERENSLETQPNKPKLPDIANKKSIKERLSSLEKFTEESQIQKSTSDLTKLPTEVKPLKERLSSLEKIKSVSDQTKRLSNGDLTNTKSVKERLSSLKTQTSEEETKIVKTEVKEVSMSLRERLSHLDAAKNKDIPKVTVDSGIINSFKMETKECGDTKLTIDESLNSDISGIQDQMQSFCRSLDSLDLNVQSSPSSFERVQSLEDFDCSEIQNNTVPSDIETEDSGIHTAHGSCVPADDIADLTQVASPVGEPMADVSEYESSNEDAQPILETKIEEPMLKATTGIVEISIQEPIMEETDDQDLSKAEDTDSASNYLQAMSQPLDESSVTDEITEIHMDKDDEDTLKSLENQDTSVIDALELAFKEIDFEDSFEHNDTASTNNAISEPKDVTSKININKEVPKVDVNKKDIAPLYENIDMFYQSGATEDAAAFPLDLPVNFLEPPKEKPPPPPVEENDELLGNGNFKHTSSARRIKKEIRNKRTSFLGIEGQVDDSYLDADLTLAPRPDITSFLQEETKIEKLLYKKTLSHNMDAKLRDSRDSGVDVDRGPSAEAWYNRQSSPETSSPHSRQNSEPYTHVTVTSDEEEQVNSKHNKSFASNLTSKLEGLHTETLVNNQELGENKIENLDKRIQEQQTRGRSNEDWPDGLIDDVHTKEVLRFERELLQLEQEELKRQRERLRESQTRLIQKSVQDVSAIPTIVEKPAAPRNKHSQNYRHSMPNLLANDNYTPVEVTQIDRSIYTSEENLKRKPFVSEEHMQRHFGIEESRKVLYSNDVNHYGGVVSQHGGGIKQNGDAMRHYEDSMKVYENGMSRQVQNAHLMRPPQPILPPKPRSRESIEREITMRSSRVPSAVEYVNVDRTNVQLRAKPTNVPTTNGQYHPMSRHTLQALSAAPSSRLMANSDWRRAAPRAYSQHWLVQEAEQRRIEEQRNKMRAQQPNQRHSYHHDPSPSATTPATLQRMQPLTTSQQHLVQEYKQQGSVPDPVSPRDCDKILSVSGKRKCSHCGEELGRGAAMIIESLALCYHVWCFSCAVCGAPLGDGRRGADVRVRAQRLHCHHCYSGDDGRKYSAV